MGFMSLVCSVAKIGYLLCAGFIPAQALDLVLNAPEEEEAAT